MRSNLFDQISFYALLATIMLLPLFFLPFSNIPVEVSKSLLLVIGLGITIIAWTIARFFDGKVSLPKSYILLSGFSIAFVFFFAALFSPVKSWSLTGIIFDVGSFWFIFVCFALMFAASVILRGEKRARMVLWGAIISFTVVLLFQIVRLLVPGGLTLGVFASSSDNLLGSWNSLGILSGLLSIISLFMIEFLALDRKKKLALGALLLFSFIFIALVNYSLILWLLGIFALVIFVFKILYYVRARENAEQSIEFPLLPLAVLIFSVLFLLSGPLIRGFLPEKLGTTNNVEVRPPLSSTLLIAKETLKSRPILGAGPNRFGEMWAMHKPATTNAGGFWDAYFDFGWGLLPTFIITTGILGVLAWITFLTLLFLAGMKSVFASILSGKNYEAAVFFLASFYLFLASFFYPVGIVLFVLAFVMAGGFIGLYSGSRPGGDISVSFLDDPRKSFFAIIFLVFLIITTVVASFKFTERFVSVSYFRKALTADTVESAEANINKALSLNWNDLYLRTRAQVYLVKLNNEVSANPDLSEEEIPALQGVLDQAINSAVSATTYNHTNYLNFRSLGTVYELAGSLGVPGGYEKALEAYRVASNLNPINPGLKLSLARISFVLDQKVEAKEYGRQALIAKPNYVEAMIFLAQVAKNEGDLDGARTYATRALSFSQGNKDIIAFIESLGEGNGEDI